MVLLADVGGELEENPYVLVFVIAVVRGRDARVVLVLAGDIGDVLADIDLRLFVVQGEQLGCGEDGDIRILAQGLEHGADSGKSDAADLDPRPQDTDGKTGGGVW
jgi:hypothetical protein